MKPRDYSGALPQKLCRGCATALPPVVRMGYALPQIGPDDFGLSPLMIDPLVKSEIKGRAHTNKLNAYGRASPSSQQAAKPKPHARSTFRAKPYSGQKGVILLQVLALLTLFGLVGLSFTFYTADVQCERNPTVERSDNGCSKTIGNTTDTRP